MLDDRFDPLPVADLILDIEQERIAKITIILRRSAHVRALVPAAQAHL